MSTFTLTPTRGVGWTVLLYLLWLVVLSPTLVESYAYRYAGAILIILSAAKYAQTKNESKATFTGWLCVGWGVYALVRFILYFLILRDHPLGERELLFCMPLAFPALAFILQQSWRAIEGIIVVYFGIALALLAYMTRLKAIFAGETVRPLIQHNQIHGAVCCGIIFIGAIMWLLYYQTSACHKRCLRLYASVVSPPVCVLCLIAIYGAKSKGVWLALALVAPALVFVATRYLNPRTGIIVLVCVSCLFAAGIYLVRDNLYRTAGPTITAATSMVRQLNAGNEIGNTFVGAIASNATPVSMDERLQLWSNAWQLFSQAPLFGWGNEWIERWPHTRYTVNYTIMHNGYLEIIVRHGVFGAVLFGVIFALFCRSVRRAAVLSVIPRPAMHAFFLIILFFSFTLLSNSNNRLAIGESLLLVSSAFALVCESRCRLRLANGTQSGKMPT